jgi:hypothetical protein
LRNGSATVDPTVAPGLHQGSATVPPGSGTSEEDAGDVTPASGMALMQAEAMAAYTRSILEPLVTALERSEDRARTLERENGQLVAERDQARAEAEALRASQTLQDANPGPVAHEPTTDAPVPHSVRLRALAPWLLAVLAIVAVIVLLVVRLGG